MQRNGVLKFFFPALCLIFVGLRRVYGQGCGQAAYTGPVNCPQGYLAYNGLCYLPSQVPSCCPNCVTAPSTLPPIGDTTTTTTTTTTSRPLVVPITPPPPAAEIRCPKGALLVRGKCRKVVCPEGEYISGRCRKAVCPGNTVWRGHSCQERGFITTVIEIDNVFKTEAHASHGNTTRTNENRTNYFNANSTTTVDEEKKKPCKPKPLPLRRPPLPPPPPPPPMPAPGCCTVNLPRTCKTYKSKWVCYNPQRKVCHQELCKTPTVYLRTPQIVEEPDFVIIPPSPPLTECPQQGCGDVADFDCSGCARGLRQTCSPYCYHYNCPRGGCAYVDWHRYCGAYPNGYGCTRAQGCTWNWCGGSRF